MEMYHENCVGAKGKKTFICGICKWLTPRSRVLLQKPTVTQLVNKLPAFYGTRRFISMFTAARHRSLSWARCIQSTYSHPISLISVLILSYHLRLRLSRCLSPSSFPTKMLYAFHITCVLHPPWFDLPNYLRDFRLLKDSAPRTQPLTSMHIKCFPWNIRTFNSVENNYADFKAVRMRVWTCVLWAIRIWFYYAYNFLDSFIRLVKSYELPFEFM
jgi:hypothetical protein